MLQFSGEEDVDQSYGGGPLQTQMTAREQRPYVNTREDSAVRFLGIPTVMRSTGETTNGAFGLIEHLMIPPGWASPYHTHHLEDERFTSSKEKQHSSAVAIRLKAGPGAYIFRTSRNPPRLQD